MGQRAYSKKTIKKRKGTEKNSRNIPVALVIRIVLVPVSIRMTFQLGVKFLCSAQLAITDLAVSHASVLS